LKYLAGDHTMAKDAITNDTMLLWSDPNLNISLFVCPCDAKFGTVWRLHKRKQLKIVSPTQVGIRKFHIIYVLLNNNLQRKCLIISRKLCIYMYEIIIEIKRKERGKKNCYTNFITWLRNALYDDVTPF
jgi:hypothetical protein